MKNEMSKENAISKADADKINDRKRKEFKKAFSTLINTIDPVANSAMTPENVNVKLLCDWGRLAIKEIDTRQPDTEQADKDGQIKQLKARQIELQAQIKDTERVRDAWQKESGELGMKNLTLKAKLDERPKNTFKPDYPKTITDAIKMLQEMYDEDKTDSEYMNGYRMAMKLAINFLNTVGEQTRPDLGKVRKLLDDIIKAAGDVDKVKWPIPQQICQSKATQILSLLDGAGESPLSGDLLTRAIKAMYELIPAAEMPNAEHDLVLFELGELSKTANSPWIRVEDGCEMPDAYQDIVIWIPYEPNVKGFVNPNKKWWSDAGDLITRQSHWMPIPDLPKEGKILECSNCGKEFPLYMKETFEGHQANCGNSPKEND